MCGCGNSGSATPMASLSLMGATDVNPLSGQPLAPGQAVVTGPQWTTNPVTGKPRQTVVDLMDPLSWPPWIQNMNGEPVDDGSVAGGTWSGPQQLPPLTTTAPRRWTWLLLAVIGTLVLVKVAR